MTEPPTSQAAEVWASRRPHEWDEPDDNGERGHSTFCWCFDSPDLSDQQSQGDSSP